MRSWQKNIEDLLHLITEFEIPPDVIVIETRLKISPSLRIDQPNYNFIDEKTKTNAGGVGIYVRDDWNFTINCNKLFTLTLYLAKTFGLPVLKLSWQIYYRGYI